jgi:antitoxin component YwqK of YwqJK toxin-antitoxin module
MIGFFTCYRYYIITIEFDDYKTMVKNISNYDYATYETDKFKIIKIEDINEKEYTILGMFELNKIYNGKIYLKINKQCIINKLINKLQEYKYNEYLQEYYNELIKFFPNGISGVCKLYNDDGSLSEEYFHNNGDIEGNYIIYYANGKIKEKCNYLNGKKHGKWTQYHPNGEVEFWEDYLNGQQQLDWRFCTTYVVPKDFPKEKLHLLD